ncbi:MAG: hypothetical protein R3C14_50740 [Caldilineaceae bacterium]
MATITLYHGTDVESALDILNSGLNKERLLDHQNEFLQLDSGWYTAVEPNVAWFFATLAAEAFELCTVIEMHIPEALLQELLKTNLARREAIVNVPFAGEQIWFSPETFDILNGQARFVPHREDE